MKGGGDIYNGGSTCGVWGREEGSVNKGCGDCNTRGRKGLEVLETKGLL